MQRKEIGGVEDIGRFHRGPRQGAANTCANMGGHLHARSGAPHNVDLRSSIRKGIEAAGGDADK